MVLGLLNKLDTRRRKEVGLEYRKRKLSPAQQTVLGAIAQAGIMEYYSAGGRFRRTTESLVSAGILEMTQIDMFSVRSFEGWDFVRLSREAAESVGVDFYEWPKKIVRASSDESERGLRGAVECAAEIIREKLGCTLEQAEETAWAIFSHEEKEEAEDDPAEEGREGGEGC